MPIPSQQSVLIPPPHTRNRVGARAALHILQAKYRPRFVGVDCEATLYFFYIKKGVDPGYDWAFWNEVLSSERFRSPKSEEAHKALLSFARDRVNGVPLKRRNGRPIEWERSALILMSVERLRKKSRVVNGKLGHYSITEAAEIVEEEFAAMGELGTANGKSLTGAAIESAYYSARKRFAMICKPITDPLQTWVAYNPE